MAGFHEIVEALHCIWQCLIEEMHNNVDERAGCSVVMMCIIMMKRMYSMYSTVQMFIVYIAFSKFP